MHELTTTTETLLVTLALALIYCYRRFISPYKNFSCAYRVQNGGASCSAFGEAAIRRAGFVNGIELIRRRLDKCRTAYHKARSSLGRRKLRCHQRSSESGHCDIPVVDCDPSLADCGHSHSPGLCDAAECLDLNPFDFGDRKKRKDQPR